jgi:hypothetical protein
MDISVLFGERSWRPRSIWESESTNETVQISEPTVKWILITRNIRLEKGAAESREENLEKDLTKHVILLQIHQLPKLTESLYNSCAHEKRR